MCAVSRKVRAVQCLGEITTANTAIIEEMPAVIMPEHPNRSISNLLEPKMRKFSMEGFHSPLHSCSVLLEVGMWKIREPLAIIIDDRGM